MYNHLVRTKPKYTYTIKRANIFFRKIVVTLPNVMSSTEQKYIFISDSICNLNVFGSNHYVTEHIESFRKCDNCINWTMKRGNSFL